MKRRVLLERLSRGDTRNVRFADFIDLIEAFGFRLDRTRGSHHIYSHPDVPENLHLQPRRGEVKPYQVAQFLDAVERYTLRLEDGS